MKPPIQLNAYQLKLIMAVIMVLDHIRLLLYDVDNVFHLISRCVAPVFAYLVVEGVMHTKNLKAYNIRLLTWAWIMALGNFILNSIFKILTPDMSDLERVPLTVDNNIFLTLALSVLCISTARYGLSCKGGRKIACYAASLVAFAIGLLCEGGILLVPFILITYLMYHNKKARVAGYLVLFAVFTAMAIPKLIAAGFTLSALSFNSYPLFIFALPFIALYNGERGSNTKFSKYFFYVFYPAHLWIIGIINFLVLTSS